MAKKLNFGNRRNNVTEKPPTKEKFKIDQETYQQQVVPKFHPATENQHIAVRLLKEGRKIVVLRGSSGSGKSMIAAWWAATLIKSKEVEKVWLLRPAVAAGNTVGLLKGGLEEKLAPYFVQTLKHLENFMGAGFLSYCVEKKVVEMQAFEYLRGFSIENSVVIIEESQNLTESDMELLLTRIGKGTTYIMTGDERQHDLRGKSGMTLTLSRIEKVLEDAPTYMDDEDLEALEDEIGVVTFMPSDDMRGGLNKALVKMYYYSEEKT